MQISAFLPLSLHRKTTMVSPRGVRVAYCLYRSALLNCYVIATASPAYFMLLRRGGGGKEDEKNARGEFWQVATEEGGGELLLNHQNKGLTFFFLESLRRGVDFDKGREERSFFSLSSPHYQRSSFWMNLSFRRRELKWKICCHSTFFLLLFSLVVGDDGSWC